MKEDVYTIVNIKNLQYCRAYLSVSGGVMVIATITSIMAMVVLMGIGVQVGGLVVVV